MRTAFVTMGITVGLCGNNVVSAQSSSAGVRFVENFDDPRLLARGWYDGAKFDIARTEARHGAGCIRYHWNAGSTTPKLRNDGRSTGQTVWPKKSKSQASAPFCASIRT